jgi:hypothetical protein
MIANQIRSTAREQLLKWAELLGDEQATPLVLIGVSHHTSKRGYLVLIKDETVPPSEIVDKLLECAQDIESEGV